jgi:ArsR family transcriptional regulator
MRRLWRIFPLNSNPVVARPRSRKGKLEDSPGCATPLNVSAKTLKDLTMIFKLLADSNRLKIVLALVEEEELHVSALCELLGQSQPAVSHHLTLMRTVGLVDYKRVGKNNYYRLASSHLRDLLEQFFADAGNDRNALQFGDFSLLFQLA